MADGTTNAGPVQAPSGPRLRNKQLCPRPKLHLTRTRRHGRRSSTRLKPDRSTNWISYGNSDSIIPNRVVNFNDITYFVAAYINYNVNHIYNPYADQNADGAINFNDISLFVGNYIAYYTSWNPI